MFLYSYGNIELIRHTPVDLFPNKIQCESIILLFLTSSVLYVVCELFRCVKEFFLSVYACACVCVPIGIFLQR